MAFKIVSGGLKLGGTATLEPEESKFKVITGSKITAPKFKVISKPVPTPKFTGRTIQSIATNPIISKALDVATKIMPMQDWEKLQQEQGAIGKAAVELPSAVKNIMTFRGQPKDVSTLGTAVTGAIEPLRRIYEPAIRAPLRATAQNIRALISPETTKPVGVGQLGQEVAKAFFHPEVSTPITRTAIPLTKPELESKGIMPLIPRAIAEAIESVLVYSPVIRTPAAKTLREGINELITKKSKATYKQSLREANNVITQYKKPGSLATKAEQLSQEGRIIPLAEGQAKQVENQIRNLWSRQIYQGKISKTPLKILTPEELFGAQPKGALLPKLVSEKGQLVLPFNEGDIVNFGKESGKILKLGAEKALLSIGGKEIEAKLSEISPKPPEMAGIQAPQPPVAPITSPAGIVTPPVFAGKAKPTGEGKVTKEFGFAGQGLYEKIVDLPMEDIPKRSITTPEYRDEDVVATAGKKVTKPIIATVEDINDPNSPIEIVDGWHRYRQALANGDKTISVKLIYKPLSTPTVKEPPKFEGKPITEKTISVFEPQPLKPSKVKAQIREVTGQVKVGDLIREDIALREVLKKEAQISKKAFSVGEVAGIEKQKAHFAEIKLKTQERQVVRDEMNKMISDINKLPTQALPLDYKDQIDSIKSQFDLKKRTQETLAKRDSMKAFVEKMQAQGEEVNIPEEQLQLLEKTTLNDMTMDDLRSVHNTLMRLYHQGSLKNKLLTTQQNRAFDEVKQEGISNITQGKGITEETPIVRALRQQNKSLANASLEGIKTYITIHLRPEIMINSLDDFTQGINTKVLWQPMINAENAKFDEAEKTLKAIDELHKPINIGKALSQKFNVGRFKGMTKDNALFIYANSFNDANRAHLIGSGLTDEDIKAVENSLTDEEKSIVRKMIVFYDDYQYPALDKIYSELEGVHLGKELNYFPIDRLEDISYNKELEKSILERNYVRRPGVSKGFTKERVSSTKGFSEFSYFNTIYRNWQKVEHYKAFAHTIRDVNKYLSSIEIKQAIKQKFGDEYYKILEKWLKDVSYGGDRRLMSTIDYISRWARTNFATSVLGYNLLTMLKQPVSYSTGAEMAGKYATLRGTAKFLTNPFKWIDFCKEKSAMMRHRGFTQERELREIRSQRGMGTLFGKVKPYQKLKESSMMPILAADRATVSVIWLSAYDDYIGKGLGEEKAIAWADQVIRRTQPMGGVMHLADVFRGPEYQKLFTLFKNQLNQNFNLTYELYQKFGKGKTSFANFTTGHIFYILLPALLIGILTRKRLPKNIGEFISDTISQVFGSLLILGDIASSLTRGFESGTTPLESYAKDIYWMGRGKKPETKIRAGARFIGKTTGLPYTGIERIFTGQPLGKIEQQTETKSKAKFPSKFKSKWLKVKRKRK